jgi:NAD(P)-dependent dehydrogenase (short-subunit alcohol dehydrogenase family)
MRFDDKVIFITGGGCGLGRECALWWAEAGGTIVVTDVVEKRAVDVAAEISGKGGKAVAFTVDVARESQVAAAVDRTVERFGRLDVMFANAGKVQAGAGALTLDELTAEQFDDVVDVVFKGVFHCGKHAARVMKPAGRGNIVVTVSASGLNAYPGFGAYGAGKTGAMGLVRSMAYEFGRFGIRCNALAPTHGMSVNFMLDPAADVLGLSYEEAAVQDNGGRWNPQEMFPGPLKVDRPPSLRDNAAVATFLASDHSEYISGVVIPSCDGGSFARTSIPIPEAWTLADQVSAADASAP